MIIAHFLHNLTRCYVIHPRLFGLARDVKGSTGALKGPPRPSLRSSEPRRSIYPDKNVAFGPPGPFWCRDGNLVFIGIIQGPQFRRCPLYPKNATKLYFCRGCAEIVKMARDFRIRASWHIPISCCVHPFGAEFPMAAALNCYENYRII